jgi:hypothetical protein
VIIKVEKSHIEFKTTINIIVAVIKIDQKNRKVIIFVAVLEKSVFIFIILYHIVVYFATTKNNL